MAVMSFLPAMTVISFIFDDAGLASFQEKRAVGTAITFIPTFPRDGLAAGSCSISRCRLATGIWTEFLCCRPTSGSAAFSQKNLWPGLTHKHRPTIASGIILKKGLPPTH